MIGYGGRVLGEQTFYYDPVTATIFTVGGLALIGGVVGGIQAERTRQQEVDALENDIAGTNILVDQTEVDAEEEARQAEEQRTRAQERILTERDSALVDVGVQQRGVQLEAMTQREDLLVASEEALGVTQAQIAASGLQGGQGSAAVIAGQVESTYDRQMSRIDQQLEQSNLVFGVTRERLTTSYEQGIADIDLDVNQALEDIDRNETFALERYQHDLDWMQKQLDYGTSGAYKFWNIASGATEGAASGMELGKSISSFY